MARQRIFERGMRRRSSRVMFRVTEVGLRGWISESGVSIATRDEIEQREESHQPEESGLVEQ